MKTILVPTDFSVNADVALYYAIELAKKENAKLLLLHAYQIDYAAGSVPYGLISKELEEAKEASGKLLKEAELKVTHAGKIKHESLSVEGFAVDAVLEVINKHNVDLVVMGTKGASGLSAALFGSNTEKVIENAVCPVIAVPEGISSKGIERITYATAYEHADIRTLKKVIEIAEPFNAQINVLHISDGSHYREIENEKMKKFRDEVSAKIDYKNIIFQILEGTDIEEALDDYVKMHSPSLLVLSTHHRDFFDKLFGKSITKQLSYHTSVPLMVFHHHVRTTEKVF